MFRILRVICAIEVQRVWRGVKVRSILGLRPKSGVVLIWKYGQQQDDIRVAGTFSKWKPWMMTWCRDSGDHRVFVQMKNIEPDNEFEFKYLVNGLWTCDGAMRMREDDQGNVNNILEYRTITTSESETITPSLESCLTTSDSPKSIIGKIDLQAYAPAIKLGKQLTSSDTPINDGIVIRPLRRLYPPPTRIYNKPDSQT